MKISTFIRRLFGAAPKKTRTRQKFDRRDCARCGKKDVAHSKNGRAHPHNCLPDILNPMPAVADAPDATQEKE